MKETFVEVVYEQNQESRNTISPHEYSHILQDILGHVLYAVQYNVGSKKAIRQVLLAKTFARWYSTYCAESLAGLDALL